MLLAFLQSHWCVQHHGFKSQAACLSALKILFASEALDGARMLLQAKG